MLEVSYFKEMTMKLNRFNKPLALATGFALVMIFGTTQISKADAASRSERAKIVESYKNDLKGYLHDYSGQPNHHANDGDTYAHFGKIGPNGMRISDKLYIDVQGAQNLKTKDDVENFINSSSHDRFVEAYIVIDKETGEQMIGGIQDFDWNNDDPNREIQASDYDTPFGMRVQAIYDNVEDKTID
jgi:hypothetical protein